MLNVETQAAIIVKKEERIHTYYCANNSNLGEIFDVLTEMRAYIAQRIQEASALEQKPNQEVDKEV